MREIKFRGKRIDNNKWIFGSYVTYSNIRDNKEYLIYNHQGHPNNVDKNSICQYTGLIDSAGVEIYEGDIIEWNGNYEDSEGNRKEIKIRDAVSFSRGSFFYRIRYELLSTQSPSMEPKVIGNIYENPELIKIPERQI